MAPSALMRAIKPSLTTVQCFEAETRIATRAFALQALVNAKSGVNANVAVGVRADLPSGEMRFEAVRVQLLLGHHENAVVVRTAFIGDREARGALGTRAVANHLHGTDANPLVTKTGANAPIHHQIHEP